MKFCIVTWVGVDLDFDEVWKKMGFYGTDLLMDPIFMFKLQKILLKKIEALGRLL